MSKSSLIEYKDLTSYIISLPKTIIENLFDHSTTCLAIFRELPELSKIIIVRLLPVEQEVSEELIHSWVTPKYQENAASSIKVLLDLGILSVVQDESASKKPRGLLIKSSFKRNLQQGMIGNESVMSLNDPQVDLEAKQKVAESEFIEKLDNYAIERWESVLKYIVNPKDATNQVSISTKDVLKFAGLMKQYNERGGSEQQLNRMEVDGESESTSSLILTASAFQFLLWNRRVQIWYFIIQLLEFCWQKNSQNISECLTLLFELSYATFGKDYSCENFTPSKEYFLQELRKLGLVFMKTRKVKRFYPTRLVIQLANGLAEEINNSTTMNSKTLVHDDGYIIVETNYRIYAYTNSHLKISLLGLFSELLYKFPNMVVATLTRESVREAYKMGITAKQIINFLRSNAHPHLANRKPVLPETVMDQITFWYNEKNRLKFYEGVFYGQFNSSEDHMMLKNHAKDLNALIWSNDARRYMVVEKSAHDQIKKYWKQNKPS